MKPIDGVNSLGLLVQVLLGAGVYIPRSGAVGGGRTVPVDSESGAARRDSRSRDRSPYLRCFVIGTPSSTAVAGCRSYVACAVDIAVCVEVGVGSGALLGRVDRGERFAGCIA